MLKATLYKFGSYITYIYRNSKLYELSKIMLPLGIVDDPDINPINFDLLDNDIILLASDGISNLTYQEILTCFVNNKNEDLIINNIMSLAKDKQNDDITLILLKITKMC